MVMRIDIVNIYPPIIKKRQIKQKPLDLNSKEPKRAYGPVIFRGILANLSYQPTPEMKKYLPKDFFKKFDYKNYTAHLKNIRYLNERKSNYNKGKMFDEGYFYSKEGLEALDTLIKYYGNKYNSKDIENASEFLKIEEIIKANKLNAFEALPKADYDHIYLIKDMLSLNSDEYTRLINSGLLSKDIAYASSSSDINNFFIDYKKTSSFDVVNSSTYRFLEKAIIKASKGDEKEILKLIKKLTNLKCQYLFHSIIMNAQNEEHDIDIEFLADNLDDFFENLRTLKGSKRTDTKYSAINIFHKLNNKNLSVFYEILNLKGMNLSVLEDSAGYLCNEENINKVKNIIEEIKAGSKKIIDIPPFKYAEVNPRIENKRNYTIQEFDKGMSAQNALRLTENGEVYAVGNETYINNNFEAQKLDLDKETYKKLFPEFETLCIRQAEGAKDCFLLSAGMIAFWKNPKAKAKLLKMFSVNGNDIIVTIPKFKNYPVIFKDGLVDLSAKHADTSPGNIMLEHAYALIRYKILCDIESFPIPYKIDEESAMKFMTGGREVMVFNEFLDSNKAFEYINVEFACENKADDFIRLCNINHNLLDKLSNKDYLLCCASSCKCEDYGIMPNHAYAIDNINKENKTVMVINPYNTLYMAVLPYDEFIKYFSSISAIKV